MTMVVLNLIKEETIMNKVEKEDVKKKEDIKMKAERKQELLNNMEEYLVNYSSDINFEEIGVSEEMELNEAFNNCLGYIVELVGSDGDKFFFEEVLGFTKEELLDEGMEWIYE